MTIRSQRKDKLTSEQVDESVLRLHGLGLLTKAIAERLRISPGAVLDRLKRYGLAPHKPMRMRSR